MSIESNDGTKSQPAEDLREPTEGSGRDSEGIGGLFPPPDEPIEVYCLHCGKEYMSSEMKRPEEDANGLDMWGCATEGCGAAGFGCDIFPTDPEWKDPRGLLHIMPDSDDDETFEWDDDEDDLLL